MLMLLMFMGERSGRGMVMLQILGNKDKLYGRWKEVDKGSLQKKNWIFYDNELISIATYPPYLIMT